MVATAIFTVNVFKSIFYKESFYEMNRVILILVVLFLYLRHLNFYEEFKSAVTNYTHSV